MIEAAIIKSAFVTFAFRSFEKNVLDTTVGLIQSGNEAKIFFLIDFCKPFVDHLRQIYLHLFIYLSVRMLLLRFESACLLESVPWCLRADASFLKL